MVGPSRSGLVTSPRMGYAGPAGNAIAALTLLAAVACGEAARVQHDDGAGLDPDGARADEDL
ncbi:hypothetical protein SAMN05216284_10241 [Micromonospora sediminimaris]|nr:hypothetical protein SAMN05216284_10241 [Micromonospora sediminimaris]